MAETAVARTAVPTQGADAGSSDNDTAAAAAPSLRVLLDADWALQHSDNPCFASQSGNHEFDGRLQDLSPAAFQRRLKHNRALLVAMAAAAEHAENAEGADAGTDGRVPDDVVTEARAFGPSPHGEAAGGGGGGSGGEGRIGLGSATRGSAETVAGGMSAADFAMLRQSVADETRALELGCHLFPVNSIGYGGVHYNFLEALDWLGPDGDQGARDANLVARLEAFPAQCEQYKELLREGVRLDRVASRAMLRKVPEQLRAARRPPQLAALVDAVDDAALKERAQVALEAFSSAIDGVVTFFEEEYTPCAREAPGCCGMPEGVGAEMYALCLRFHTTTMMTPSEVHTLGRAAVARIEARYQHDVLDALAFKGSFADFVAACHRPDSGHYFDTQEELLDGYRQLCATISKELPRYFAEIPSSPLEVVAKDAATAPAAYYMQGTADGARPGRFYVNVSNLAARPKYEMTSLALHEGVPGHHHQNALAIENPAIPPFRRFIEDRRYEFCPARRQLYAAYLEGWALYCEHLGEEMGMYKTPYDLFGRLSMEMMRAVRLVVDTGIHALGWSVEKAIAYMMEKTGMHRHECEAECFRYEAWPGQACAYFVGYVAIRDMRAKAERALGAAFDVRKFHSVVLASGPMTLDVLGTIVEGWAEEQAHLAAAAAAARPHAESK